jgi:tripartite-type tricarboxylate transporter receptor subunit TctC
VPYKGSPPAFTDLLAGRIDLFFDSIAAGLPYVQSGQAKGIAVLSSKRSPLAPDVPTMSEAGVPGLDVDSWLGIFAPAKDAAGRHRKTAPRYPRLAARTQGAF